MKVVEFTPPQANAETKEKLLFMLAELKERVEAGEIEAMGFAVICTDGGSVVHAVAPHNVFAMLGAVEVLKHDILHLDVEGEY